LVNQYEERIEKLQGELEKLRPKAERFEAATTRSAETENKLIFLERRNQELETRFKAELAEIQNQTVSFRTEAKALAVEIHSLQTELKEKSTAYTRLKEDHDLLKDQFESLQAVWADAQKKIEASKLQHEALNKLNQELSRQLKEMRRSNDAAIEANSHLGSAKIKEGATAKSDRLEKIDTLLAEIESGFTARFTDEPMPATEKQSAKSTDKNVEA
jgi:chromosome segregation ATPase